MNACPCGSGEVLRACCGPLLDGHPAPTAERLMRSRYSAFVLGNDDHLFRTWHPRTRPAEVHASPDTRWLGLDVLRTEAGLEDDQTGVVEFVAHHADGHQHEVSRFERRGGRWVYVDGV